MPDLQELMDRDPLEHTRESLDELILVLRDARQRHMGGEKSAGSMKPKAEKPVKPLDLDDLGL